MTIDPCQRNMLARVYLPVPGSGRVRPAVPASRGARPAAPGPAVP